MANRRSTVEFTDVTEPLLKQLEISGFDIKSTVNAGVLLFNKLSGDEQKEAIAEANGAKVDKNPPQSIREALRTVTETAKKEPGTIIEILSKEEASGMNALRKALGPGPKKRKKKMGG